MRRVAAAVVVMFIAGCTAPDAAETTASETSELNGGAASPMPYRVWSPTVPVDWWFRSARNMTIVVYTARLDTYAWGVADGVNVTWVYKMTNAQRPAFIQQAIDGLQTMSMPGDENSWIIQGGHGGNPPTPTPGTTEFSVASVNRVVRTIGTSVDAFDATKKFESP